MSWDSSPGGKNDIESKGILMTIAVRDAIQTINPATGELLHEHAPHSREQIEHRLDRVARAFWPGGGARFRRTRAVAAARRRAPAKIQDLVRDDRVHRDGETDRRSRGRG